MALLDCKSIPDLTETHALLSPNVHLKIFELLSPEAVASGVIPASDLVVESENFASCCFHGRASFSLSAVVAFLLIASKTRDMSICNSSIGVVAAAACSQISRAAFFHEVPLFGMPMSLTVLTASEVTFFTSFFRNMRCGAYG